MDGDDVCRLLYTSQVISKSVWTSCVQGVVKYVRVTFDLFPDQRQVCVAAVDYAKCQPVNSWRDEDQELSKVRGRHVLIM